MGTILDTISDEIILKFQIGDRKNLEIKEQINVGFSGAEVYLIELYGKSLYKGIYFLKIDTDDEEFKKSELGYCFTKAAKNIQQEKIQEYYVILLEIAGKSSIEYKAFYDIDIPVRRIEAVKVIVPNMLNEAILGVKEYVKEEILATTLFQKQLGKKLKLGNSLEKFLSERFNTDSVNKIAGFRINDNLVLPNAYSYAVCDSNWKKAKLRDTNCCIHGDLNGNNIFFSFEQNNYSLIDFSSYRKDGYVFYDTAYFELSLLLHNFENQNLNNWLNYIEKIMNKDWDNLECLDMRTFIAIEEAENLWIEDINDEFHSYKDSLFEARIISRVLAGLNYAGKQRVNNEIRRKAFLFACCYLMRLLEIKGISEWKVPSGEWHDISKTIIENDEINCLLNEVDNFNDSQKYILVLGNKNNYDSLTFEALSRIHWSGIVTFKRTESIEQSLKIHNIVNAITISNIGAIDLISSGNMWCLYADGVAYDFDTLSDSFSKWRNDYVGFLNLWSKKIDNAIAPEELQILVDLKSFSSEYHNRLERLFECLDLIKNTRVKVSIITDKKIDIFKNEEYENLEFKNFKTDIGMISEFCMQYLRGTSEMGVTIPCISNRRKKIPENDYKFIKTYVTVIHNRIIYDEEKIEELDKYGFYYGKRIAWQAIEEKLYIERAETEQYYEKVQIEIDKECNQFLIRLLYKPGAGASVLCRILGWKFRDKYPVIIADNMNKNIVECLQKLYSLSGKHLLLILDGDFCENDVNQLIQQAKLRGIKLGVLYLCRCYEEGKDILSILSVNEALKFANEYTKQIKKSEQYAEKIIEKRSQNMKNLALETKFINYRLPFFFGMYAFEEDFLSVQEYLKNIKVHLEKDEKLKKVVNYIALITYYTEEDGLNIYYVKKMLKTRNNITLKDILYILNGELSNLIYYDRGIFKICHSVVAYEILQYQSEGERSVKFEKFLEEFIKDICDCEGKADISDRLNNLLMNLFIKRDVEGDIADNLYKKNFSPIVLSISNSHLQEQLFEFLVNTIPNNAHFRQHYGRLIIYNSPDKLEKAKFQFDEAIRINPTCALHYHARGNMYTKYMMYLCKNKYEGSTAQELFSNVSQVTEAAIEDYESSIQLIISHNDISMDLSYPYASILQTSTYVVHQLYLRNNIKMGEKEFLKINNSISNWCEKLIQKAEQYDIDTAERYDLIRSNQFYNGVRKHLIKYQFDIVELAKRMDETPDDIGLITEYLFAVDARKDNWKNMKYEDLLRIVMCCRKIICNSSAESEGILWRWFNACIHVKGVNINEMIGILETMEGMEENLTAHFMLYTIKVCIYLVSADERYRAEVLEHIRVCRKLNKNSNKVSTRYYYNSKEEIGLCFEREKGTYLKGTVSKWVSPQNGHLTLEACPQFTAFFVPSIIGLREEGAVGTKVLFKLGFSFDGLRAWDVKIEE